MVESDGLTALFVCVDFNTLGRCAVSVLSKEYLILPAN